MGPGQSAVRCTISFLLNIPIYVLCAVFAWSYYTVIFVICAGNVPQYFPNSLFVIPYNVFAILFFWSFWRSAKTIIPSIPKQYCLSPVETATFIELDDERARAVYLEKLVETKSLSITVNNKHGTVPFCDICFLIKPDRTHHCSSCEQCVPKMDHHCPWINNCVGYHNHKYFLLLLFYTVCYCLLCFFSTLGFFTAFINNQIDMNLDGLHVFFLFIISLVFAIAVFALLLFQFVLLLNNSSTLEHFRGPNFRNPNLHASFNLGWKANFMQVFGRRPLLWCLPIFSSQGDGLSFPIKTTREDDLYSALLYDV